MTGTFRRALAIAAMAALLAAAPLAHAAEAERVFAVDVPGLGPMLFPGKDARSAVGAYVDSLVRRQVFPNQRTQLRAWQGTMQTRAAAGEALDDLRAKGAPVIGIQLNEEKDLLGSPEAKAHRRLISAAVRQAGGLAVFLPPAVSDHARAALVAGIDHLLLAGGRDIDPSFYGQENRSAHDTNRAVDHHDIQMVHAALDRGMGIDGICRGHQLLNVALDGTLIQDLAREDVTQVPHRRAGPGPVLRHAVALEPHSAIAESTGALVSRWASVHHQAVATPGEGLSVVGRSPDGVIEAVEGFQGRVRGYQFHPELSDSQAARGIFRSMIQRAARGAR